MPNAVQTRPPELARVLFYIPANEDRGYLGRRSLCEMECVFLSFHVQCSETCIVSVVRIMPDTGEVLLGLVRSRRPYTASVVSDDVFHLLGLRTSKRTSTM